MGPEEEAGLALEQVDLADFENAEQFLKSVFFKLWSKSLLHLYCSDRVGRDKVPSDHRRHHVAPVTNCHLLEKLFIQQCWMLLKTFFPASDVVENF